MKQRGISIFKNNLKVSLKEDDFPVSNDLKVNEINKKINELTPDIPIVSEEL